MSNNVQTETEFMLTTIDNPFDYFEDFQAWFTYDVTNGYYCCNLLARFANLTDEMTQKERDQEIERAIDEIILHDFRNIYKKVSKEMEIIEPIAL